MECLQKFLPPDQKPGAIHTKISLEFIRACEDLIWNHDKSTPYRSETNGIAENAVRTVKENSSALLVQSGLSEKWWGEAIKQTRQTGRERKLPYARRFGT